MRFFFLTQLTVTETSQHRSTIRTQLLEKWSLLLKWYFTRQPIFRCELQFVTEFKNIVSLSKIDHH